jgi:hypothetical protein
MSPIEVPLSGTLWMQWCEMQRYYTNELKKHPDEWVKQLLRCVALRWTSTGASSADVVVSSRCLRLVSAPPWERLPPRIHGSTGPSKLHCALREPRAHKKKDKKKPCVMR